MPYPTAEDACELAGHFQSVQSVVVDPADLLWVDTLSVASDRHLYATATQLTLLSPFHEGKELRRKPCLPLRLPIDAGPFRLV